MIGIYKYQNKLNGKIYIGQSIDIARRYEQHLYDAKNRPKKGTGVDLAIRKYGIENFDFSVIEECPTALLDDRECYWINYYNSYKNGYNRSLGGKSLRGSEHPRAILDEDQIWEIRELYGLKVKRSEVYNLFKYTGISERGFKKIWDCETQSDIHTDVYTIENREWHKKACGHDDQIGLSSLDRAITQEEIDEMLKDFQCGLSINAIAKKYHRDNGVVEKYMANPIAINEVKYKGRKVQCTNTGEIFNSISSAAKWAGCGATTLTRHLAKDKIAGKVPGTNEPAQWLELS